MLKGILPLKAPSARIWLISLSLCSALESLLCGWLLWRIPGGNSNQVWAGLSLPRLLVLSVLGIGFLLSLAIAFLLLHNGNLTSTFLDHLNRPHAPVLVFLSLAVLALWLAVFLPAYRFGAYADYYERLRPLFLWFLLVAMQFSLFLAGERLRNRPAYLFEKEQKKIYWLAGFIFLMGLVLFVFIAFTRWGIAPIVQFWEKTGVPLLALQIFVVWVCGMGLLLLRSRMPTQNAPPKTGRIPVNLVIFLAIWIISAALWVGEPIQFNHFNPGPFPPNFQYYPNSDAEVYDLTAQRALIGKSPGYVDKPFYSTLLLGFHLVVGQDVNRLLNLQTMLLAVFPALLFLLGTRLQNRVGGLLAALLANFKEINAMRAQTLLWKTVTPRLMMSEFLTAVLLALLVLFLWRWFSRSQEQTLPALAVGGILGLAVLTRHNNWVFFPLIILIAIVFLWQQKRALWVNLALFILMLFATIGPWMWYSNRFYGQPLPFMTALTGSVFKNRLNPLSETAPPPPTPALPTPTEPASSPPWDLQDSGSLADSSNLIIHPVIDAMTRHFFHNLIATALTLPVTPHFDDLETTLRTSDVASLWDLEWKGLLTTGQVLLLLLNLLIVSVGVAQSWQRWQIAGLMPLIVGLAYLFATAFATTSGGRYIVPADWVIYFYYALGTVQVLGTFFHRIGCSGLTPSPPQTPPHPGSPRPRQLWQHAAVAGLFILIGLSIPVSMLGFPQRFPAYSQSEIVEKVLARPSNLKPPELAPLLAAVEQGELQLVYGRFLNPKYLDYQDDRSFEVNLRGREKGSPALIFNVLGAQTEFLQGRLLMEQPPPPLPNGAPAVVFTCPGGEAWALLVWAEQDDFFFVHPDWPQITCDPE